MTIDTILIEARPGQTRTALLQNGRLVQLVLERSDLTSLAGTIHLGRVESIADRLDAAFVDIGGERSGFLGLNDVRPAGIPGGTDRIGDYLAEGDTVLVQVLRDPEPGKGAKLTARISLPGRFAVFLPLEPGTRLSKRIEDRDARKRLTVWAEACLGQGEGVLLRTAAEGADARSLEREIGILRETWQTIERGAAESRPPVRLHTDAPPTRRLLRDLAGPELTRIAVDGTAELAALQDWCAERLPGLADCLEAHRGPALLFEAEGVEEQIEAALRPRVPLPSGGAITIEATAALVAVDVDSGAASKGGREETALTVNLEAAAEIARQLRLRNLAGLIMVDFLRLKDKNKRKKVLEGLRRAVEDDPEPVNVAGFTTLDLVEMTRRKTGEPLARVLGIRCPHCDGGGLVPAPLTTAYRILEALRREALARPGGTWRVRAAPSVIGALNGPASPALAEAEKRLGRKPTLEPTETLDPGVYDLVRGD